MTIPLREILNKLPEEQQKKIAQRAADLIKKEAERQLNRR